MLAHCCHAGSCSKVSLDGGSPPRLPPRAPRAGLRPALHRCRRPLRPPGIAPTTTSPRNAKSCAAAVSNGTRQVHFRRQRITGVGLAEPTRRRGAHRWRDAVRSIAAYAGRTATLTDGQGEAERIYTVSQRTRESAFAGVATARAVTAAATIACSPPLGSQSGWQARGC